MLTQIISAASSRSQNKASQQGVKSRLSCESLERRELFASDLALGEVDFGGAVANNQNEHLQPAPCEVRLEEGRLFIDGTVANDSVTVDYTIRNSWYGYPRSAVSIEHTCGGVERVTYRWTSEVDAIEFRGMGGNDYFLNNTSIESLGVGGSGNDTLIGGSGNDIFYGDIEGNGRLVGGHGMDVILGRDGNDSLYGGGNNDYLFGGDDRDFIFGQGGNDFLFGQDGNDWLFGGIGDDLIYGHDGVDALYGNQGDDTLYGGAGDDYLFGQEDNDLLYGEDGKDRLYGGDGDDELDGGRYDSIDDILTGGEGADHFYNEPCADQDNPTDYAFEDGDIVYGCLGTPIGNPVNE